LYRSIVEIVWDNTDNFSPVSHKLKFTCV